MGHLHELQQYRLDDLVEVKKSLKGVWKEGEGKGKGAKLYRGIHTKALCSGPSVLLWQLPRPSPFLRFCNGKLHQPEIAPRWVNQAFCIVVRFSHGLELKAMAFRTDEEALRTQGRAHQCMARSPKS